MPRITYPLLSLALGLAVASPMAHAAEPLLDEVPPGTVLRIGDPVTQKALEISGLIDELSFEVEWANISGGPQGSEAFRAKALDVSTVAEIPSIHATWTDLPVRNIAYREREDPIAHPVYRFGVTPALGDQIDGLEDFKGRRVAYSPGQAQGALVLRALEAAGLTRDDVTLVELPSTGDVYPVALAAGQVDIAPLGGVNIARYLSQYGDDGARTIDHGLRDDPSHLWAPQEVLDDPAKAAALAEYVRLWARATEWINDHPEEYIQGYYVKDQNLSYEDGKAAVEQTGRQVIPSNWDEVIERHTHTIALLAEATGNEPFDAEDLFDRRFEKLAAEALSEGSSATKKQELIQ
ncbi:ABC transporter substrate-binding protein [Paracoccus sp. S3-43]|uniref:ABC transporter substrate-binding protein n=1 Tax=Paracoccus sp. S3-43 TaxID=3030011 RepID=UPI0023AFAA5A|nr:ABC transporter substrate-binding protein [Paracoccus sp. S3-43]WEF25592.1 ABC transporter substrate-binding protein [Paracoccus sp. S3-43]